jgi:hypothetical protein
MIVVNSLHQKYFSRHLPSITEFSRVESRDSALASFLTGSVLKILRYSGPPE